MHYPWRNAGFWISAIPKSFCILQNARNIKENPSTYVTLNGEMYQYMPDHPFSGPCHLPVKANFYQLTKLECFLSFSRFNDLPVETLLNCSADSARFLPAKGGLGWLRNIASQTQQDSVPNHQCSVTLSNWEVRFASPADQQSEQWNLSQIHQWIRFQSCSRFQRWSWFQRSWFPLIAF